MENDFLESDSSDSMNEEMMEMKNVTEEDELLAKILIQLSSADSSNFFGFGGQSSKNPLPKYQKKTKGMKEVRLSGSCAEHRRKVVTISAILYD
jgi:hypothetical protein